jgi:hypothetical protein
MSEGGHRGSRLELFATILLAAATVATAWSGYQASRWNGEQAKAFNKAGAKRVESTRADSLANSQTQIDVAVFSSWVDAIGHDEPALAAFYRRRFRPEFRPAVVAWEATKPFTNPDAPLSPFRMPQYTLAARVQADRLEAEADALAATGRTYVQRSTNYVLGVVLFASALFLAGISTKLQGPGVRRALLVFGVLVFVATLVWIATFPISFAV